MNISGLSCLKLTVALGAAVVVSVGPDANCKMGSLLSPGSTGVVSGWLETGEGGLLSTRWAATATTTTGGGALAIAVGASAFAGPA